MDYLESKQKLLGVLTEKLADSSLANRFISDIFSIGRRYSLTFGEIDEICALFDKIIKEDGKEKRREKLEKEIFQILGVREGEILEVSVFLEEMLDWLADTEIIVKKLKLTEKELVKREN